VATPPLTDEQCRAAVEAVQREGGQLKAATALDMSRSTLRHRLAEAQRRGIGVEPIETTEGYTQTSDGHRIRIVSISRRIRTVEEALQYGHIDPVTHRIVRARVNSWEAFTNEAGHQTLWQVRVDVEPLIQPNLQAAIDRVLERVRESAPRYPRPRRRVPDSGVLLEFSPFDHHFGKLAWAQETGENYDLAIARRVFVAAAEQALGLARQYPVEHVYIPVGQDWFHIDGWTGETVHGTPQDTDGRWPAIFETGLDAIRQAVDMFAGLAHVTLAWVPGNHDWSTSWTLARCLACVYESCDRVTVDTGAAPRKYLRWGTNLVGFTHGNEEKHSSLPTIMATERPEDWAATTDHEWHLGHWHVRRATTTTPVDTHDGVTVRILPSLCGRDAWHHRKGYLGTTKAAEAYLWHREQGLLGSLVLRADPDAYRGAA